jgi:hypothetical protein
MTPMLFLYRPPQTAMPFMTRSAVQQDAYRRDAEAKFAATRRVAPGPDAGPDALSRLEQLGELHSSGVVTDEEFAAIKARLLDAGST